MRKILFILICIPVLLGPWMFGAWELWWFWPFTLILFLAGALFGVQQFRDAGPGRQTHIKTEIVEEHTVWPKRQRWLLMLCLPIIFYGAWWLTQPVVYMLAERSWLLFVTSVLLGAIIVFGFSPHERRLLFALILANLVLLGLYGIINHLATGSQIVLWAPGYPQYFTEGRASGSYFCPNHFAGIMELGVCLGLGIFLTRRVSQRQRIIGLCLIVLGCAGVVLSKSRGGGLTLIVIFLVSMHWGFVNWPKRARWWWRTASLALGGIVLLGMLLFADGFTKRFTRYFVADDVAQRTFQQTRDEIARRLQNTSRARMYRAAVRGWKTSPVTGIGPGMHSIMWPHFNASSDGDPEAYVWPSEVNAYFTSYETHSDWLELLEEYGIIGFILVLVPTVYLFRVMTSALRQDVSDRREHASTGSHFPRESMALGAVLSLFAMVFHSLADFNLQMPATAWLFASIITLPLGMMGELRVRSRRS